MLNLFKVDNKDTRTTSSTSLYCLYLLTYFTPSSSVSVVDFETVNVNWDALELLRKFFYSRTSDTHLFNPFRANIYTYFNAFAAEY